MFFLSLDAFVVHLLIYFSSHLLHRLNVLFNLSHLLSDLSSDVRGGGLQTF